MASQVEVHPSYEFTDQEWHNLPHAERNRVIDERARYKRNKRSGGVENRSVISEITTTNQADNDLHGQLLSLQHRISTMESQSQSGMVPGSIMGGRNEQANIRSRNSNNDNRSIRAMKLVISTQKSYSEVHLSQPSAGTMSYNELDSNADTCCLGSNFTVIAVTDRTADVYPYDTSYTPIKNVPIVSGATVYTDSLTGDSFILVIHEALYYGTKLGHSLINPNQLRQAGTMVWDNPFDTYHGMTIDTDMIDVQLETKGTKIRFQTHAPSDDELANLPHLHLTSDDKWEPARVVLGNVQHTVTGTQIQEILLSDQTKYTAYSEPKTDEAILHSVNSVFLEIWSRG